MRMLRRDHCLMEVTRAYLQPFTLQLTLMSVQARQLTSSMHQQVCDLNAFHDGMKVPFLLMIGLGFAPFGSVNPFAATLQSSTRLA